MKIQEGYHRIYHYYINIYMIFYDTYFTLLYLLYFISLFLSVFFIFKTHSDFVSNQTHQIANNTQCSILCCSYLNMHIRPVFSHRCEINLGDSCWWCWEGSSCFSKTTAKNNLGTLEGKRGMYDLHKVGIHYDEKSIFDR